MCSGKSTIASCLAGRLNLPRYELDELRWSYYAEMGYDPDVLELNEHFVKHPSNRQLAKRVVYTRDKTPDETCEEVLHLLAY
jgi:hypothetical protein